MTELYDNIKYAASGGNEEISVDGELMKSLGGGGSASPNLDPDDPQGQEGDWRELIPEERQEAVRQAFSEEPRVVTMQEDTVIFRYHSPGQDISNWFSPVQYSAPAEAQQYLALPLRNTATEVSQYIIPRGTRVLYGGVQGQAGRTGLFPPHASGGGMQYYVPDPSVLVPIP